MYVALMLSGWSIALAILSATAISFFVPGASSISARICPRIGSSPVISLNFSARARRAESSSAARTVTADKAKHSITAAAASTCPGRFLSIAITVSPHKATIQRAPLARLHVNRERPDMPTATRLPAHYASDREECGDGLSLHGPGLSVRKRANRIPARRGNSRRACGRLLHRADTQHDAVPGPTDRR